MMNKLIVTLGIVTILGWASCTSSPPPPAPAPNEQGPPAATPPPPPKTEAEKEKDGTTIKVDKNGVQVRTKDGSKVNDVKINKDSSSVEIKRPK